VELIKDKDRISIRLSELSDQDDDRKCDHFHLDLHLSNGDKARAMLIASPTTTGIYKPEKLLLDGSVSDRQLNDLRDLSWHVFPVSAGRLELPPFVFQWNRMGLNIVACLPDKYGDQPEAFDRQLAKFDGGFPDPDRSLCWWPDTGVWDMMEDMNTKAGFKDAKGYIHPFYTFSEWFAMNDLTHANYSNRAMAFARHLRNLRTSLFWHRRKGHFVKATVANAGRAKGLFKELDLDPESDESWAGVASKFEPMSDCFLEEAYPCGPRRAISKTARKIAFRSMISHLPRPGVSVDCVAASIYAEHVNLINIFAWCNPLEGPGAFDKATDAVLSKCEEYGAEKVVPLEGTQPFMVCQDCGQMMLLVSENYVPENMSVSVTPKVGRNDPCPCGSGKKYKKCCGRAG